MQEYLTAKQVWELERDAMIQAATPETLNDVTRNLSHITALREAQLAAKYVGSRARVLSYHPPVSWVHGYQESLRIPARRERCSP